MSDEIAPGIFRLELPMRSSFMRAVNVYLVRDQDGFALVDCGLEMEEAWTALVDQLAALGVSSGAIHTLIGTHGHPDHVGLAERLRTAGARLWLHGADERFMQRRAALGDGQAGDLVRWLVRHGFPTGEAQEVPRVYASSRLGMSPPGVDRALEGGEALELGDYRFEVLWTPGHTPGHICLLEPSQELLLSGDHILPHVAPNVSLHPDSDENPMPAYLESLEMLAELPIRLALPGHGHPFGDLAARARGLHRQQIDRQAELLRYLHDGPQTTYELAARVWRDSKPQTWREFRPVLRRNAVGTLAAHLEMLVDRRLATRLEDECVRYASTGYSSVGSHSPSSGRG
jgi:glyoxylase-like metal-dependent hydrolase (beta-lactamase superfamily II)